MEYVCCYCAGALHFVLNPLSLSAPQALNLTGCDFQGLALQLMKTLLVVKEQELRVCAWLGVSAFAQCLRVHCAGTTPHLHGFKPWDWS